VKPRIFDEAITWITADPVSAEIATRVSVVKSVGKTQSLLLLTLALAEKAGEMQRVLRPGLDSETLFVLESGSWRKVAFVIK